MMMKSVFPNGVVYIEEVTISDIIAHIVTKHEGVQLSGNIKERMMKMIARRGKSGIGMMKENKEIHIDIYIVLHEITSFFSRCTLLQEEIKQEVEWMTGFVVKTVNVHIEKVLLNNEK